MKCLEERKVNLIARIIGRDHEASRVVVTPIDSRRGGLSRGEISRPKALVRESHCTESVPSSFVETFLPLLAP